MVKLILVYGKAKIEALLGQHKAIKAIRDPSKMPTTLIEDEIGTMELAARGTLVLNLSDNVLRQVVEEENAFKMWTKLNELYITTNLPLHNERE